MTRGFATFMLLMGLGFLGLTQFTGDWLDWTAGLMFSVLPWVGVYLDEQP